MLAGFKGGGAVICCHVLKDAGEVRCVDDDGNRRMVLGRGADHGRAADVDVFNRRVVISARCDGLFKRVEIDRQKVDVADGVLFHGGDMFVVVAQRKKAAVDHRVQCLDPAVHHFGETGIVGDVDDGDAGAAKAKAARRPACARGLSPRNMLREMSGTR